jgi:CRP/FNR family transcriptional regulator, cyclic AMP receptor protein
METKFEGELGRRRLTELLADQKTVRGNAALATELADSVEVMQFKDGDVLITEGAEDTDVYLILDGALDIWIRGKKMGQRTSGNTVGEMAAIQPGQRRSATVRCVSDVTVAKLRETELERLAGKYPEIWHQLARELSRRLLERNRMVARAREKIRVFVISSREAIPVVEAIENAFEGDDDIEIVAWKNGIFKVANYPLEDLERELDLADLAVAVAQPDDIAQIRKNKHSIPRDNVVFELAYFMGRLGRKRSVLMEPATERVKLPSDYDGVTTIRYKFDKANKAGSMATACNRLRDHIRERGPFNE